MSEMSYPVERMTDVAARIRSTLDASWGQHAHLLQEALIGPAHALPAPAADLLTGRLNAWQARLRERYDALHALADALEGAAHAGSLANATARTTLSPE